MCTPPIVKIVRPHALHLKLRAEPSAECQEYVGEVDNKQHVRLLDCGWEVVNGFLLVAALTGTPPVRGYIRACDVSIQHGGFRYLHLTDDAWWFGDWSIRAEVCDITVHDAVASSIEALAQDISEARRGLEAAKGSSIEGSLMTLQDGYTYVSLWIGWPCSSPVVAASQTVYKSCHLTLGYLARMSDPDRKRLQNNLRTCLHAYMNLLPEERPLDNRVFYARRWRVRPHDWRQGDPDVYTVDTLVATPEISLEMMIRQNHVYDPWISEDEEHDMKIRQLHKRDRDRFSAAKGRAANVPAHSGVIRLVQAKYIKGGRSFFALDPVASPELHDLMSYLTDWAVYCKSGQITYRSTGGRLKTRPPICCHSQYWHASKQGAWIRAWDD